MTFIRLEAWKQGLAFIGFHSAMVISHDAVRNYWTLHRQIEKHKAKNARVRIKPGSTKTYNYKATALSTMPGVPNHRDRYFREVQVGPEKIRLTMSLSRFYLTYRTKKNVKHTTGTYDEKGWELLYYAIAPQYLLGVIFLLLFFDFFSSSLGSSTRIKISRLLWM